MLCVSKREASRKTRNAAIVAATIGLAVGAASLYAANKWGGSEEKGGSEKEKSEKTSSDTPPRSTAGKK